MSVLGFIMLIGRKAAYPSFAIQIFLPPGGFYVLMEPQETFLRLFSVRSHRNRKAQFLWLRGRRRMGEMYMSMIDVVNLTFGYEGSSENVFENVSFQIDTNWKLGFVGRNGRGKTTFLSLLLGKYEYQGRISASVEFEYFPYPVEQKGRLTLEILEEINPQMERWQLLRELNLLKVDAGVLYRPFDTLSYGEQTKVLLAVLFLGANRFLLIDEPTNHLDVEGRDMVAEYLNRKRGFLLVSHDRSFLDACTDHTLSINKRNIEIQKGSFQVWYEGKCARDAAEAAKNEKLKSEIGRLTEAARRSGDWSDKAEKSKKGQRVAGLRPDRGYIGHKSAKMMRRAKNLERRQQKAIEDKSVLLKNVETMDVLRLYPLEYHGDRLAQLRDVRLFYGERSVCGPVALEVHQGERICLRGKNGCGKSSILKLLCEQAAFCGADEKKDGGKLNFTGAVQVAAGLKISCVPQDASWLCGSLEKLAEQYGIEESLFKAMLRKLDFPRKLFERDTESYSAGQKKKVLLAKSLCERAHLYVWDEPLDYIDVLSRIQSEELILRYQPTMLFVEHDRAFCERTATRMLECGR